MPVHPAGGRAQARVIMKEPMQEPDAPITWDQYANAMQVLRGHDACVRRVSRAAYGRATRVVERFRSEHNMSERGKVTPERVAALRAFGRQAVLGRQTPRGAVVRDLLSVIDELSQYEGIHLTPEQRQTIESMDWLAKATDGAMRM